MFPFCWRIWVRELALLAWLLLLLAEPDRGEKEPDQTPGRPPLTSSDFSISVFWKYLVLMRSEGRREREREAVQSNIIISAVAAGLAWTDCDCTGGEI